MPQVLINREQLPHLSFDVELLGDCDVIVNELCHRLGADYKQLCYNPQRLSQITAKPLRGSDSPACRPEEEAGPLQVSDGAAPESDVDVVPADGGPVARIPPPAGEESERPEHSPNPGEKSRYPGAELRRRCWAARSSGSSISKRLDGKWCPLVKCEDGGPCHTWSALSSLLSSSPPVPVPSPQPLHLPRR